MNKYNSDYKVIIVGDASMSPYEIHSRYGSVEHYNEESGVIWLERLKNQFTNIVWLNPVRENEWKYTLSIGMLEKIINNEMYPLTIGGISKAMESLKN